MSAIRKGFAIIEAVTTAGNAGLPFARIVEATGVPKATAHRLLKELVELSALTLDPVTRCYRGGMTLARFGSSVLADYDLRQTARPALQALHAATGHVATLGMRHDLTGVYLDKIEGRTFGIRMHSEIGKPFPLHCTAMGKVLLAYGEAGALDRLLEHELDPFTANTIVEPAALREEIARVSARGYAMDVEEITRGLVCIAAPVFGFSGAIEGAMSCTFPSYLQQERGVQPEINAVLRCARQASTGGV